MSSIRGVNVSSVMNRQMHSIGNAQAAVKHMLGRLAAKDGRGGSKLNPNQSAQVSRKSRVAPGYTVYAMPYGEEGFSIFYYRGGDQDESAHRNLARFSKGDGDAAVWALYLGRFEGNDLIAPGHDNTPCFDDSGIA